MLSCVVVALCPVRLLTVWNITHPDWVVLVNTKFQKLSIEKKKIKNPNTFIFTSYMLKCYLGYIW